MLPVLLCALAVAGCLFAEARGRPRWLWLAKPLASASFLWAALAWGALAAAPGRWLAAGLACCAAGDVLLIPRHDPALLRAGMLAFGLGHLAFAVGFAWPGLSPGGVLLGALAAAALVTVSWRWLRGHAAAAERGPLALYLAVIALMLTAASGSSAPALARIGAWLFALSDLAVAQDRFVAPSFASTLWGLPAYYAAQLLIAWGAGSA